MNYFRGQRERIRLLPPHASQRGGGATQIYCELKTNPTPSRQHTPQAAARRERGQSRSCTGRGDTKKCGVRVRRQGLPGVLLPTSGGAHGRRVRALRGGCRVTETVQWMRGEYRQGNSAHCRTPRRSIQASYANLLCLQTTPSNTSHNNRQRALTFAGLGDPLLLLCGLEDLEGAHQRVVHAHHGAGVVELAAVVGRREDGHQLALGEELVPVLHHLQCSTS
jgi:hypothetical protein